MPVDHASKARGGERGRQHPAGGEAAPGERTRGGLNEDENGEPRYANRQAADDGDEKRMERDESESNAAQKIIGST